MYHLSSLDHIVFLEKAKYIEWTALECVRWQWDVTLG